MPSLAPTRHNPATPTCRRTTLGLEPLEDRTVPTLYTWSPFDPATNIEWSYGPNWLYDAGVPTGSVRAGTSFNGPGVADTAIFEGADSSVGGALTAQRQDCNISGTVTVKGMLVKNDYEKTIKIAGALNIRRYGSAEGGVGLLVLSSNATLRGPTTGDPGAINIGRTSDFQWKNGTLRRLTVTAEADQTTSADNGFITVKQAASNISMTMDGCAFNISGALDWQSGDVRVTAASSVTISTGAKFYTDALGGRWGVVAGLATSKFLVTNHGRVLHGDSASQLGGDYSTDGSTEVTGGTLELGGKAEQSGGVFTLDNSATVKLTGSGQKLQIYAGVLCGKGTVDGNLICGNDNPYTFAGISPGFTTYPNMGIDPPVYHQGTININGDFTMVGTTSYIDIASNATSYGRVAVSGKAALNGLFYFLRHDDFKPTSSFTPFSFGSNPTGSTFQTVYVSNRDYDVDGVGCHIGGQLTGTGLVIGVSKDTDPPVVP